MRTLLRRCLQKDPQQRLRNAGDARLELEDESPGADGGTTAVSRPLWNILTLVGAVASVAGLSVVLAALYWATPKPAEAPVRKWIIPQRYQGGGLHLGSRIPIISPDGSTVAYVDGGELRIRDLNALASRAVPTPTEGATAGWPVFSPDGTSLAFAVTRGPDRVSLFRMPAAGGDVSRICDLPPGLLWGFAWRPDGTIIANVVDPKTVGLYRVEQSGGNVRSMPIPGGGNVLGVRGFRDGTLGYMHSSKRIGRISAVGLT